MAKNLFVTIYINYSCSRHHSAHVRDVAFKRSATQLFHAQANSPTTFLLTGSFSSTCCPSVVVMLLMVTASRALGTWWKGSVCPSVPRWMASSVISIHTRLWSRKVIWELYFQSHATFRIDDNFTEKVKFQSVLKISPVSGQKLSVTHNSTVTQTI